MIPLYNGSVKEERLTCYVLLSVLNVMSVILFHRKVKFP